MIKKKLFLIIVAAFLLSLTMIFPASANPDTEDLYVDGFTSVNEQWTETGSSPWLNNSTANYIETKTDEYWHEEFTFTNTATGGTDTINSVTLYAEINGPSARNDTADLYIWDGTAWTVVLSQDPDGDAYVWYNVAITGTIDTWAKIDGAKLKVQYQRAGSPSTGTIYVRRAYLQVDYSASSVGGGDVTAPSLSWPENNQDNTLDNGDVYFEWTLGENAENSRLEVATVIDFTSTVENTTFASPTNSTSVTLGKDNYYYRVWSENLDATTTKLAVSVIRWFAVTDWQYTDGWTGTIKTSLKDNLVETWTGTIKTALNDNLIETWTGTIRAATVFKDIEFWNGTLRTSLKDNLVETWTGTVRSIVTVENLIETWTGIARTEVAWLTIDTWTGTLNAPSTAEEDNYLIETWTGTVRTNVAWSSIESWSGTVRTLIKWNLIESWSGSVRTSVSWSSIEGWTGTVRTRLAWTILETWSGTVNADRTPWALITSPDNGSIFRPNEGFNVQSVIHDPDGLAMTVLWNFGDFMGTSTDENTVYVYPGAGDYIIMLTVTDAGGLTDNEIVVVSVTSGPPVSLTDKPTTGENQPTPESPELQALVIMDIGGYDIPLNYVLAVVLGISIVWLWKRKEYWVAGFAFLLMLVLMTGVFL